MKKKNSNSSIWILTALAVAAAGIFLVTKKKKYLPQSTQNTENLPGHAPLKVLKDRNAYMMFFKNMYSGFGLDQSQISQLMGQLSKMNESEIVTMYNYYLDFYLPNAYLPGDSPLGIQISAINKKYNFTIQNL